MVEIKIPENKFTKKDWIVLKYYMEGWHGEIHHCCGKQYEYLCFLQLLSVEEHRGKNAARNYKYPDKIPKELMVKNAVFWGQLLDTDDYHYFMDRGLVWGNKKT